MQPAASSTPPTTPTKRVAYRQKEILTTPRSAKTAALAKTLYTGPNYVKPSNFDDETHFSSNSSMIGRTVQVGNSFFTYGKNMAEYKDSTELYRTGKRDELLARLETEGYLLIRGAINHDTALTGRNKMITHLHKKKAIDLKKGKLEEAYIKDITEDGWTVDAETGGFVNNRESEEAVDGWREIGWCPEVRNIYNGEDIHAVYRFLWGKPRTRSEDGYVALSQNTWLRAKARGEVTSEHADYYYFKQNTTTFQENRHPYVESQAEMWNEENPIPDNTASKDIVECDLCLRLFVGSQQSPKATAWDKDIKGEWHCHDCASQFTPFYTCWISLGVYNDENSTLCMMPKTHNLTEFDHPLRTDLLPEDYNNLVKQKWGWLRTNFGLGDIVIFNWKTVHGASKNTMEQFRFSIDTRVCSSWFRPKALVGDDYKLQYNYPAEKAQRKAVDMGQSGSGRVDSEEFTPTSTNTKCPAVLSAKFLQEQALLDKAGIERKRRIGNISSKPKVMGMGMGGACKPKKVAKKKGSKKDEEEEEEEEEDGDDNGSHCELESLQKQQLQLPPQSPRKVRAKQIMTKRGNNKKLGADGVGRFGNDDDGDESDMSQSSQPSTPSRRQQRILRESDPMVQLGYGSQQDIDKFSLGVIEEETKVQLDAEEEGKQARVRKAQRQDLGSDSEDDDIRHKNKRR